MEMEVVDQENKAHAYLLLALGVLLSPLENNFSNFLLLVCTRMMYPSTKIERIILSHFLPQTPFHRVSLHH